MLYFEAATLGDLGRERQGTPEALSGTELTRFRTFFIPPLPPSLCLCLCLCLYLSLFQVVCKWAGLLHLHLFQHPVFSLPPSGSVQMGAHVPVVSLNHDGALRKRTEKENVTEGDGTHKGVNERSDRHLVLLDTFTIASARTCHDIQHDMQHCPKFCARLAASKVSL